ncbi:hypothetical protein [Pontibacter saemangeumensis]|uniref:hypothetical protein n=1 Tax=Pontibacter saemangeumensis TaxID=1084525 RepID=UPI0031EB1B1F
MKLIESRIIIRFTPTRFHGILDYVVGLFFIAYRWLFGFSDVAWVTWTIVLAGVAAPL